MVKYYKNYFSNKIYLNRFLIYFLIINLLAILIIINTNLYFHTIAYLNNLCFIFFFNIYNYIEITKVFFTSLLILVYENIIIPNILLTSNTKNIIFSFSKLYYYLEYIKLLINKLLFSKGLNNTYSILFIYENWFYLKIK